MSRVMARVRLHLRLDEELVRELDRRVGPRPRSAFVEEAVRRALDDQRRWELIWSAVGTVRGRGHPWDRDPAAWVRAQRHGRRG